MSAAPIAGPAQWRVPPRTLISTTDSGTVIESLCDFCHAPFAEEAMIEGHQGSLLCLKCLSAAFADLELAGGGAEHAGGKCTMCLENRNQPQWQSPMFEDARVCLRCIKQAATAMEKDPDTGWKRPAPPG